MRHFVTLKARARNSGVGMPFKVVSGAGVGAAAVVVGLSLAGPQALGVASADSTDAASASSEASSTGAGRAGSVERSAAARAVRRAGLSGAAQVSGGTSGSGGAGRPASKSTPGLMYSRPAPARVVPNLGVVTGGVGSVAASIATDVGVGEDLSGAPAADALATKVSAAATAVSAKRSVTRRPAAVRPPDLTSVATVNAQINSGFDSLANLLTGLPQGPVADFLGGALLLVRRSLFNQAPTANPVQYGQTETDIVGTLGAVDVEGNPITYIVSQAPQHGTVSIAADGFYTYIPTEFATTDSTDTFTVSVADSATRLLGPISTDVVVPVSINGVEPSPPQSAANTFFVYNWSQYSVKLLGIGGDWEDLSVRPKDFEVIAPGHSFRYVLNYSSTVRPDYLTSNGVLLRTELSGHVVANDGYVSSSRLEATEGDQSSIVIVDEKIDRFNGKQFILDPPNTAVELPAGDGKSKSNLVNWMCGDGPGNCSFDVKSDGVQKSQPGSPRTSPVNIVESVGTGLQTINVAYTRGWTQSETRGYELNGNVTFKFGEVAGLAIGGKWSQSWTTSSTETWQVSQSVQQNFPPYSYNVLVSTPNVDTVTGDVVIKLWNTTWTLKNIKYSFPSDKDCEDAVCKSYNAGSVVFRSEPTQAGFMLQDKNNRFPGLPEYVLGARVEDNKHLLTLSAFNGTAASGGTFSQNFNEHQDAYGNLDIKWTTSNPDVATIEEKGKLTIKAPGEATITATYTWKVVDENRTVVAKLPIKVTAP